METRRPQQFRGRSSTTTEEGADHASSPLCDPVRGILFAALALPALLAGRAEAAPQLLGLVASNGVPTPLQCKGGVCGGFFSSFCLQQYRPAPLIYTEYRLAPPGGLTLLVTRADSTQLRLPAEGLVTIRSEIDFSSVTMSIPEARLKALGAVSAAIEVAPLTSILPVPVAGDATPPGRRGDRSCHGQAAPAGAEILRG